MRIKRCLLRSIPIRVYVYSRKVSGDLTRYLLSRDFAVKIKFDFLAKRCPQTQTQPKLDDSAMSRCYSGTRLGIAACKHVLQFTQYTHTKHIV